MTNPKIESRKFTRAELQRQFRHYNVTEWGDGVEWNGEFVFAPKNRRSMGDEVLLFPSTPPVNSYGEPVDLTTTQIVDLKELEQIFQLQLNGRWALVRFGELVWLDPEQPALRLTSPKDATHMQVQVVWNGMCCGRPDLGNQQLPLRWLVYGYRRECENDPNHGTDFYMFELSDPEFDQTGALEHLRQRMMVNYSKRTGVEA